MKTVTAARHVDVHRRQTPGWNISFKFHQASAQVYHLIHLHEELNQGSGGGGSVENMNDFGGEVENMILQELTFLLFCS